MQLQPRGNTDDIMLEHVQTAYTASDVRLPIVLCLKDGNPYSSVVKLAAQNGSGQNGSTVWPIHLQDATSESNALDYLQVGLQNGDWLYLSGLENLTDDKTLRDIGRKLMHLMPNPKDFPKCGFFRLWLVVQEPLDLSSTKLIPNILAQHAIYGTKKSDGNPKKVLKQRVEPELAAKDEGKRQQRRERGEDSDAESDHEADDPERRGAGMLFHRATEFYTSETENAVTKSVEDIFEAIQKGDVAKVSEIINLNTVDFNMMRNKANMTPLHWAIMCDDYEIVKLLLENDADPNVRRGGPNGQPPLFLPIEQVCIFEILWNYGADIDQRWEGKALLDHSNTAPGIKEWLKKNAE